MKLNVPQLDVIQPLLCSPLVPTDQCYRKFNDFINAGHIIDEDYYCFSGDDDMFEPGFFDVVRQQTSKILINSNYRGDSIPNDGSCPHPVGPLVPRSLGDIRINWIGLSMFIVKGEILRQTRFANNTTAGDGAYAENLKNRWPNDIAILPDLFVFGNFFQPGRHTKKECFLKPSWELPRIIQ